VSKSTVRGNSSGVAGGGISAVTLTLTDCTISKNSAFSFAGGISASLATLTGCAVSGNSTGLDGGGIYVETVATLANSTISGNTAGSGGGISASTATLTNCTVAENFAQSGGGLLARGGGSFRVRNTIVALNSATTDPDVFGDFTSDGHNLIGNGNASFTHGVNGDIVGTNVNPIDPKLGPLQINGGKTKTMALLAGSRAIDRGDNAAVPATDQRGLPRRKDGNGDGVAIVDIGAFER
jgi:predicted outer membrane repeat protein